MSCQDRGVGDVRQPPARLLAGVAFAGLLSSPALTARLSAADNGVLPLHAKYKGLTSGDWLAVWWQEAFAVAVEKGNHPLNNGGAVDLNNHMVALVAPIVGAGSPRTTIPVTLSPEQHLFVGIISVECSGAEEPPFHGDGEADLRACANGLLDMASDVYVAIDGRPVKEPASYRTESPLFRYGPLPAGNYLGLKPGTQSDAVAAGHGLLLSPLSVGEHRILVRASVPAFNIAVDTRFIISVEPTRGK